MLGSNYWEFACLCVIDYGQLTPISTLFQ